MKPGDARYRTANLGMHLTHSLTGVRSLAGDARGVRLVTKAEGFVMSGNRLFCDSCGKENRPQARFCGYCGKAREDDVPEWVHEEKRKLKFRKTYGRLIWSVIHITLALCVYLWARSHSPYMGFGEMITTAVRDPNYFILNEGAYTAIMVVIAGLALAAVLEIILALAAFSEE